MPVPHVFNILEEGNAFSQSAKMFGLLARKARKLRVCIREVVHISKNGALYPQITSREKSKRTFMQHVHPKLRFQLVVLIGLSVLLGLNLWRSSFLSETFGEHP